MAATRSFEPTARAPSTTKGRTGTMPIIEVRNAWYTMAKTRMLGDLRLKNAEGIVFKRHDAPYSAGRPASGRRAIASATAS